MELLFKDTAIGSIKNVNSENLWFHGVFEAYEVFDEYKEFFQAIVCEDGFDESKFANELLDDENWNIRSQGKIDAICLPAIYEDGDISFRYR